MKGTWTLALACMLAACSKNVVESPCPSGQLLDGQGVCRDLCQTDLQCDSDLICAGDLCVPGERAQPVIHEVDADGAADVGVGHVPHRIVRELTIRGENLEGSGVILASTSREWELDICSTSSGELVAALPDGLTSGDYLLTVVNQGGSCGATLPILQGEQGVTGAVGAPGPMPETWEVGSTFECEGMPLASDVGTGQVAADTTASGGQVRQGTYSASTGGRLWGIYASDLGHPFGISRARYSVRAKVDNITATGELAKLSCLALRAGTTDWTTEAADVGTIIMYPGNFDGDDAWTTFSVYCDFLPDDVDQFVGVDDFAVSITDLSLDFARVDSLVDDALSVTHDEVNLHGSTLRNATMLGDPRSAGQILGYHYDSLIRADQRDTTTLTLSGGFASPVSGTAASLFDGNAATRMQLGTVPATIEIDFGAMEHYWYALAVQFTWGTGYGGSTSFLIEKYYDDHSDDDWDSCGSADSSLGWAPIADVTDFAGYNYITRSHLGSGICRLRITFRDIVGTTGVLHVGQIAAYQYYNGDEGLYVRRTGDTIYGTLNVDGQIQVGGTALNVPDFVFRPEHELMPLDELRTFVTTKNHLPNVPSASEVQAEGIDLVEFQLRLLEKIEEQTLYTLSQQDLLNTLESANEELLRENRALEKRVQRLEKSLEKDRGDSPRGE